MYDYTERGYLTRSQYRSGKNLEARRGLYDYLEPKLDLVGWALGHLAWTGEERVIDIGCGTGAYLRPLQSMLPEGQAVGVDLSAGMLGSLKENWTGDVPPSVVAADAQALPFPDGFADVVLAMHMLYHVPNIGAAIQETRRVLRPDGVLLATTNADDHLSESDRAYVQALRALAEDGVDAGQRPSKATGFTMENGASLLKQSFSDTQVHVVRRHVRLREPGPLITHITSSRDRREEQLPAGVTWDRVIAELSAIVDARVATHGTFDITSHVALFVCR